MHLLPTIVSLLEVELFQWNQGPHQSLLCLLLQSVDHKLSMNLRGFRLLEEMVCIMKKKGLKIDTHTRLLNGVQDMLPEQSRQQQLDLSWSQTRRRSSYQAKRRIT